MKRISLALMLVAILALSASAQWQFQDVSRPEMEWTPGIQPTPAPYASCVAWGDVDNDGRPDLFVGSRDGANCQLYMNTLDRMVEAGELWGINNLSNVRSAQFVDYDGDGRLDLFCLTDNAISAELFRQTENGRFQPVTLELDASENSIRAAVWSDLDADGNLDLILSGDGNGEIMTGLINTGHAFTPARAGELPENIRGINRISIVDFDLDGDLDILCGSDQQRARFLANRGDGYVDLRTHFGLANDIAADGIAWADFNNDGFLDFATCGTADQTYLYMGRAVDGELSFSETFHNPFGDVDYPGLVGGASSVHAIDANMDGWTDLFYVDRNAEGNYLLINDHGNGWTMHEAWRYISERTAQNTAAAWADYDGDGDLDLAIAQHDQGIKLFRNDLTPQSEYFSIRLADYYTDTPVLNCRVQVKFENSKQWATTSLAASTQGYDDMTLRFSNPDREIHSREIIVAVCWPSGAVSTYNIDDIALYGTTTLRPPNETSFGSVTLAEQVPELSVELANIPNPFNPSTSVNFTIPMAGEVNLAIYNLLGQEVASLVRGYYEAGLHTVQFDASALPSGLYLARLQAAGETKLHRMLLTK